MPKNGSKMAKNALNDPIFGVQALKTSYFLITNVIGPIQGEKSGKKYPPCCYKLITLPRESHLFDSISAHPTQW